MNLSWEAISPVRPGINFNWEDCTSYQTFNTSVTKSQQPELSTYSQYLTSAMRVNKRLDDTALQFGTDWFTYR